MITRYEGVIFVNAAVQKMTREAFIAKHCNVFWLDRKSAARKKMLGHVYDLITKTSADKQ